LSSSLGALGWDSAHVVFTYFFQLPASPDTMLQQGVWAGR
jgi:hypothetical protein